MRRRRGGGKLCRPHDPYQRSFEKSRPMRIKRMKILKRMERLKRRQENRGTGHGSGRERSRSWNGVVRMRLHQ